MDLTFSIASPWIIKGIILSNEKLFKNSGGMFVVMQTVSSNQIVVPLQNEKNTQQMVDVKVIVGQGLDSASFHTIEVQQIQLKKFQMF